jgi:hypothetical protein
MLNRREFFSRMIGGVAAAAAVRMWPFRVYSFPTEVVAPPPVFANQVSLTNLDQLNEITKLLWTKKLADSIFAPSPIFQYLQGRGNPPEFTGHQYGEFDPLKVRRG